MKAPVIAGALSFLCLGLLSCEKKGSTHDWTLEALARAADIEASHTLVPVSTRASTAAPGLRFMFYNVENWLSVERDGKVSSKPESEKTAVVRMIVDNRPDVLGVCEMGDKRDIQELQAMLKKGGWEMHHLAYNTDSHALRRLALLSRFPIVETAHPEVREYRMNGRNWRMSRPVLDATVERDNCRYRFVGVHLKSKREIKGTDQELMRINEAALLRRHVEEILRTDPHARLIAYGDFNDTRKSVAVNKITGKYRSPTYLTAVPCSDTRGHRWTHHWEWQDVYSRFDYVLVSVGLKSEVDFRGSYIVDGPSWNQASDHRALVTIFKPSAAE